MSPLLRATDHKSASCAAHSKVIAKPTRFHHHDGSLPAMPCGSFTQHRPSRLRRPRVRSCKSRLLLVVTAGPWWLSNCGIATDRVFPARVPSTQICDHSYNPYNH